MHNLMTMMVIRLVMMLMLVTYDGDANYDYDQDYECQVHLVLWGAGLTSWELGGADSSRRR